MPTLRCRLLRAHISSEGDDNGQSVAAAPGGAGLFIISTLLTDQLFSILPSLLVHRSSFSLYLSIGILGYVSHIQCFVSISSVVLEGPQSWMQLCLQGPEAGPWAWQPSEEAMNGANMQQLLTCPFPANNRQSTLQNSSVFSYKDSSISISYSSNQTRKLHIFCIFYTYSISKYCMNISHVGVESVDHPLPHVDGAGVHPWCVPA